MIRYPTVIPMVDPTISSLQPLASMVAPISFVKLQYYLDGQISCSQHYVIFEREETKMKTNVLTIVTRLMAVLLASSKL